MISKKSGRVKLYIVLFVLGLIVNAANLYLYLYRGVDGNFLLYASAVIPLISLFCSFKITFRQGLLASLWLAFPALLFALIEWLFKIKPLENAKLLYGLGWALSELVWFFAPFIFHLLIGGIAALVKFIREKKEYSKDLPEKK